MISQHLNDPPVNDITHCALEYRTGHFILTVSFCAALPFLDSLMKNTWIYRVHIYMKHIEFI